GAHLRPRAHHRLRRRAHRPRPGRTPVIHHVIEGPAGAPAIIFGNSLGTDHHLWDEQVPALRSRFRVVRFDARGHGASSLPPGPYRIEDLGNDVLGLADRLGLERFHYCGLSVGGQVGLWLGLHAPARLESLVLANTGAKIGSAELWTARIDTIRAGGM